MDKIALAFRRPKRLALTSRIVLYDVVCSIKYILSGTVVLLQTNDLGIAVGAVKIKNVFNGRTAEFIDALVVVTYYHEISISVGQKRRQHELGLIRILILVHANVLELALIIFSDVLKALKQTDCLNDNIIKIKRVRAFQLALILGIDSGDLGKSEICANFIFKKLRGKKLILCTADLVHNRFYGQCFIIYIQLLHR